MYATHEKIFVKILVITIFAFMFLFFSCKDTKAAWSHDGFGYTSNFCRSGPYYQYVSWNYVGTDCYMPLWNLFGKRTPE